MPTSVPEREELRRRIDAELDRFLAERRGLLPPEAGPILDELEAVIHAGGKRLRPVLACLGHAAAGAEIGTPILRTAAALELLHTFALVQDDVMDRSSVRRGRVASHRALAELARQAPHHGDPDHFGVSAALLVGDLAMVCADRLLAESGFDADALGRARRRYDDMRTRAVAGQYLDLLAAHRGQADEPTARRIGRLKTAGYSVADPLAIGALLHDDRPDVVEALEAYGFPLGEAFQILDDIRGAMGFGVEDPDEDLRNGKQTVLLARARSLAVPADRRFLDEHVGRPDLSGPEAEEVRRILDASGALEATRALVDDLVAEGTGALEGSVLTPGVAAALRGLAEELSASASPPTAAG